MPLIFVSYRREDSAGHAGRLFDRLQQHFGGNKVFWDVSGSIEPGEQFDVAIERAVGACDVLLAVIGQRWADSTDTSGARRLDQSEDFVRLEIGKALRRGVRVIPVLVHGATLPTRDQLPEDLRALARHQAVELSDARWDFDISQLLASLDHSFSHKRTRRLGWWAVPAVVGLVAALSTGYWYFYWPASGGSTQVEEAPDVPSRVTGEPDAQQRVQVPPLKGLPLDVVRTRLSDVQLRVGDLTFLTLGRDKSGTVYCQKSAAGSLVRVGSEIDLCVEREKLPGIKYSGQIYLSDSQVFDLDGTSGPSRGSFDVRFDASEPSKRVLQPRNGATMAAMGRRALNVDKCAATELSSQPIRVTVGTYLCVRTNIGNYAQIRVEDLGEKLKLSFDTWEAGRENAGTVRLVNGESYHFKTGESGRHSGGDLYVGIDKNGGAQFWANNRGQNGILDLGDIGGFAAASDIDLAALSGFYKFGVPAIPGHTYVAQARDGEEGHFIVFDVTNLDDYSLTLSYRYE